MLILTILADLTHDFGPLPLDYIFSPFSYIFLTFSLCFLCVTLFWGFEYYHDDSCYQARGRSLSSPSSSSSLFHLEQELEYEVIKIFEIRISKERRKFSPRGMES